MPSVRSNLKKNSSQKVLFSLISSQSENPITLSMTNIIDIYLKPSQGWAVS